MPVSILGVIEEVLGVIPKPRAFTSGARNLPSMTIDFNRQRKPEQQQ
jgi:hypothetical protein